MKERRQTSPSTLDLVEFMYLVDSVLPLVGEIDGNHNVRVAIGGIRCTDKSIRNPLHVVKLTAEDCREGSLGFDVLERPAALGGLRCLEN